MDYHSTYEPVIATPLFRPSSSGQRSSSLAAQVLKAADERLRASSHVALRAVSCEYRGGALVLRGRVSSHYLRQLAQETVRALDGVDEVVNLVEVVAPPNE